MTDLRPIPLFDLKPQQLEVRAELVSAISAIVDNCQFVLGDAVSAFEADFASFCGTDEAIAVNSGTSALHLALLAAGVGPGDEVITVPHTFVATVAAVLYVGAKPILVDIDPVTLTMDPSKIESAISPRTKVILPVHLYGQAADMKAILSVAKRHGLMVIEDAAQAHGAEYSGRPVGSLGDMGCFSFYPSKNLGANGEGGAITTSSRALAERVRMLRDWGQTSKGVHQLAGFNYRMDGFQGAVLGVKLKRLPEWTSRRVAIAHRYAERLNEVGGLEIVGSQPESTHVYHLFVVRCKGRDTLAQQLRAKNIFTGVHYPHSVHLQPAYLGLGYQAGDFPVAEHAARSVLSLPMYPGLGDEDVDRVSSAIRDQLNDRLVA